MAGMPPGAATFRRFHRSEGRNALRSGILAEAAVTGDKPYLDAARLSKATQPHQVNALG